jgi:hypothetical protein
MVNEGAMLADARLSPPPTPEALEAAHQRHDAGIRNDDPTSLREAGIEHEDFTLPGGEGGDALQLAIMLHKHRAVRALLKGDFDRQRRLDDAFHFGDTDTWLAFAEAGAKPDEEAIRGALARPDFDGLSFLAKAGVDKNLMLDHAVAERWLPDQLQKIGWLLDHGADPAKVSPSNLTTFEADDKGMAAIKALLDQHRKR